MRLLEVLHSPVTCFRGLTASDWRLPLGAMAVIFLCSIGLQLLLGAFGMSPKFRPTFSELTFLGAFGLVVGRAVVYASVCWWTLHQIRVPASYGIVVSVISTEPTLLSWCVYS